MHRVLIILSSSRFCWMFMIYRKRITKFSGDARPFNRIPHRDYAFPVTGSITISGIYMVNGFRAGMLHNHPG